MRSCLAVLLLERLLGGGRLELEPAGHAAQVLLGVGDPVADPLRGDLGRGQRLGDGAHLGVQLGLRLGAAPQLGRDGLAGLPVGGELGLESGPSLGDRLARRSERPEQPLELGQQRRVGRERRRRRRAIRAARSARSRSLRSSAERSIASSALS